MHLAAHSGDEMSNRYQAGYVNGCRKTRAECEDEIERLRAERDQWRSDCELCSQTAQDRLATLQRLKAEYVLLYTDKHHVLATDEMSKENVRLREALKDIAIGCGERVLTQDEMRARAFDALEQNAPTMPPREPVHEPVAYSKLDLMNEAARHLPPNEPSEVTIREQRDEWDK